MTLVRTQAQSKTADTAQAVALRRWALRVLSGEAPAETPVASPASWALFLETERCALPLQRCLGQPADPNTQAVIADRAILETQRVLSARAQLQQVATIARAGGWKVAVLKGGVPAANDRDPIDLHDLDLLVAPEAAEPFAAALDAAGYRVAGTSSVRHEPSRMLPESVPIEIHWSTDPEGAPIPTGHEDRLIPLKRLPGLAQLLPREHLWSILLHLAIDHPDRRGNLRDLQLLASAWSACGVEDLTEIARRKAVHPYRGPLDDLLLMAESLARALPVEDRFEELAATVYFLKIVVPRLHLPDRLAGAVAGWVLALRLGPAERRRLRWRVTMHAGQSALAGVAAIERRSPRVGRVIRIIVRATLQAGGLLIGAPLAILATRAGRRAAGQADANLGA